MPRLPPHLLWTAHRISPLLPLVLRGCRTLPSAVNELRWLREHVQETSCLKNSRLLQLCQRRARGEPLQYILGSQPFGELDIKCRPGVLIPRLSFQHVIRSTSDKEKTRNGGFYHTPGRNTEWKHIQAAMGAICPLHREVSAAHPKSSRCLLGERLYCPSASFPSLP